MIAWSGRLTPGLSFLRAASFQDVILPRKIPANVSGVNFNSAVTPGML